MSIRNRAATAGAESADNIKQCCARLYESDFAKILLGDSFHPGGLALTERLGVLLDLGPTSRVLDVASGPGNSAFFITERFGCAVTGIDYSERNVRLANESATNKGVNSRVRFELGDAERLNFRDASFDAIVCECAFCTFPDKTTAAREFARVLRPNGRVGISDLTREATLPKELDSLLAWIACIADAQTVERYYEYLKSAGVGVAPAENHDEALLEMVRQIQGKLLVAEISSAFKKIDLVGIDFASAKQMANAAISAIKRQELGYSLFVAEKATAHRGGYDSSYSRIF
jgi:arsenite methyltransferase